MSRHVALRRWTSQNELEQFLNMWQMRTKRPRLRDALEPNINPLSLSASLLSGTLIWDNSSIADFLMITLGQAGSQTQTRGSGPVGPVGPARHWWVCTHVKTDRKCVRAVGLPRSDSWCQQMPTAWTAFWEKISSRRLVKRLESMRLTNENVLSSDFTRFTPRKLKRISKSTPPCLDGD